MASVVRIGLVGCGAIARMHLAELARDARARVVLLCDPDIERSRGLARTMSVAPDVSDRFERCLEGDVDAVVLCSPTGSHYEQSLAALDAGLDVLCEKPLASSGRQIRELIDAEEHSGRILSVSYQRRYQSAYRSAKRELADKPECYGPVREAHVFVCERWEQTIRGTWRDDPAEHAGYFSDAGSHQIDTVWFATGLKPKTVFATSERRERNVEIVTRVLARLDNGAGLVAHFVGNAHHWREDIHFHCARADLLLRGEKLYRAEADKIEPIALAADRAPDAAFLDAILSRQPTDSSAACALLMHRWINAVCASIKQGTWVEVE